MRDLSSTRIPLPDTGDVAADLRGLAHGILRLYRGEPIDEGVADRAAASAITAARAGLLVTELCITTSVLPPRILSARRANAQRGGTRGRPSPG